MELGVIDRMGFNAYFLIVWDFVNYAKDNGIAVGPGRGSAAGSIVAYCLSITDVDPLRYDLLFERFLNPERVSMPDIDIDFSVRGRERVMRYVTEKYGRESVAQIVTFGKMFPRAATRDAARVLGHDYGAGDRLAKLIPDPIMGRAPSFEDCLAPGQELQARPTTRTRPRKQIVDVARGLEGIVRNSSIHAAAVVIADRPLTDIVPLQLADAGTTDADGNKVFKTVTQFSMKPVEELGLLKMDFLGLRNLDVIEDALDIIERSTGVRPDMTTLPLDDAPTYEMLARGDSVGVFQFESEGMREALQKVRPTEFDDLVALVALYRPGAMDQIPTYARGKRDPESVAIPDERLRADHRPDQGRDPLPGAGDADRQDRWPASRAPRRTTCARRSARRTARRWRKLKPEFFEGCRASGTDERVIEQLWATNEKCADYSFNKSHAACYALIAYRTAWLKANHPAEYMAALISQRHVTKDKVPFFVAQARRWASRSCRPDVNLSDHEFVGRRGQHPLRPRRGQGRRLPGGRGDQGRARGGRPVRVAVGLLRARRLPRGQQEGDRGADQVRRVRLDRRDAQGHARRARGSAGRGPKAQQDLEIGQGSIFDLGDPDAGACRPQPQHPPIPAEEFEQPELLAVEKESIGLFISAHPLKEVREALQLKCDCRSPSSRAARDGDWVTVGGIITQAKKLRTKTGTTHDVRDARRPRGRGRDRRLREGAQRVRGRARRRRGRARARPRRPQGGGQDRAHRAVGRAVQADARGGRARAGQGARARDRRGARPAADLRPTRPACRRPSSTTSSTSSAASPGSPRSCSSSRPARAPNACALVRNSEWRRRRLCAPSSSTSSVPRRSPPASAQAPDGVRSRLRPPTFPLDRGMGGRTFSWRSARVTGSQAALAQRDRLRDLLGGRLRLQHARQALEARLGEERPRRRRRRARPSPTVAWRSHVGAQRRRRSR